MLSQSTTTHKLLNFRCRYEIYTNHWFFDNINFTIFKVMQNINEKNKKNIHTFAPLLIYLPRKGFVEHILMCLIYKYLKNMKL